MHNYVLAPDLMGIGKENIERQLKLEEGAVRLRAFAEQAERNEEYERQFLKLMQKGLSRKDRKELKRQLKAMRTEVEGIEDHAASAVDEVDKVNTDGSKAERIPSGKKTVKVKVTPTWHISYYSEADKKRIEGVMKRIHYNNYRLFPTIDECITIFREKNS